MDICFHHLVSAQTYLSFIWGESEGKQNTLRFSIITETGGSVSQQGHLVRLVGGGGALCEGDQFC